MKLARLFSILPAPMLGAALLAVTAAGKQDQQKQTKPAGTGLPQDTRARTISEQQLGNPLPIQAPTLNGKDTVPPPDIPKPPEPPPPPKEDTRQTDSSGSGRPTQSVLPRLTFPDVEQPGFPVVPAPNQREMMASNAKYTGSPVPVLPFVLDGLFGSWLGFALSIPALWLLNDKVLSKRPQADSLALSLALQRFRKMRVSEPASSMEDAKLEDKDRTRLGDSDYALSHGYITPEELKGLRSSSLAIGEMSFALGVIGVIAAISFGINGWARHRLVVIMAAAVVFTFTLLSTERYHKYRSAYKTLVLLHFDKKSAAEPGGSAGTSISGIAPTVPDQPSDASDHRNTTSDQPNREPDLRNENPGMGWLE